MHAPKKIEIIARALAVHNGRALVCWALEGDYGFLPGGHVEPGETAAEALAREFLEEAGLEITVGAPLLFSEHRYTQSGKPKHEINLVFHVEPASGAWPDEVQSLEPQIGFRWIDPAAAVDAEIYPDTARALIASGGALPGPGVAWVSE